VVRVCGIPLGHGQHVNRHQQQGLDGPEVGVLDVGERVGQALGALEEELRLVELPSVQPLDDGIVRAAGGRRGQNQPNRKYEIQVAEERGVGLQGIRIAGVERALERRLVEYLDETARLPSVSVSPQAPREAGGGARW